MSDDCYPGCRAPRVRFVCPRNGELTQCEDDDHAPAPHVREELARAGAKLKCETHGVRLVRA